MQQKELPCAFRPLRTQGQPTNSGCQRRYRGRPSTTPAQAACLPPARRPRTPDSPGIRRRNTATKHHVAVFSPSAGLEVAKAAPGRLENASKARPDLAKPKCRCSLSRKTDRVQIHQCTMRHRYPWSGAGLPSRARTCAEPGRSIRVPVGRIEECIDVVMIVILQVA